MNRLEEIKKQLEADPKLPPTPEQVKWLIGQIEWLKKQMPPDVAALVKELEDRREDVNFEYTRRVKLQQLLDDATTREQMLQARVIELENFCSFFQETYTTSNTQEPKVLRMGKGKKK